MAQLEKLVVSLEARVTQYEKALAKATATTNRQMAAVESRFAKANGRIAGFGTAAFGGFARGAALALAPILSVSAAINTAKAALQQFGDIADNAKASGLDSELWQSIATQAELGGVAIGQISDALTTFNRNSGLAAAGTGRMATALAKLNPELLRNLQGAKTQDQRLRLAADAIAAAGSSSEKAALSVALFGDAGAKLADVFSGGAKAIDAAMKKARDLGLIIDRDLIARADKLGDEFDVATKVMDLQFKQALVDLAPLLTGTANLIGGVVTAVRGLIEQFSALDARSTGSLEERLAQIRQLQSTVGSDVTLPSGEIVPSNPMAVSIGGADTGALAEEMKQIEAILTLRKALEVPVTPPGGGGGYNAIAQEAIDKAAAVLEALKFEAEQLGRTALEQEIYNNLKAAGVSAESEFGKQIAAATIKLDAQKTAIEANKAAMAEFGDIAKSATLSMIDDLLAGKSAAEAFGNVLSDIGSRLIGLGLDGIFGTGGGGNTGALGQLFGLPGHASGTANTGGVRGQARGIVHGQEAVIPLPSGGKIPVSIKMPGLVTGGGPQAPSVPISIHIDATGADAAGLARVRQEVAVLKMELPGRIKHVVKGRGRDWI